MSRTLVLAASAAAVVAGAVATAAAQDEKQHRWKMHSAFTSKTAVLGAAGVRVAETITEVSKGTVRVRFFEPNALVPGVQYLDAVSTGSVDAAWGTPGYHAGQIPAAAFFTAVPFGPGFGEYNAWIQHGGGKELYEEIMEERNIKALFCGMIPPEASGWFREPVDGIEDMSGMKMRFFGLGARVVEKFGVSTQLLAGGDIYPALELGTIDATEFSMPSIDQTLGFHQIAEHYYLPGWHQPSSFGELLVNMDKWNELSDWQKKVIEVTCGYNIYTEFVDGEQQQPKALQEFQEAGVEVHTWSDEDLAKLEEAWLEVAEEQAEEDEVWKKVWDSYSAYREEYALWGEEGYLK